MRENTFYTTKKNNAMHLSIIKFNRYQEISTGNKLFAINNLSKVVNKNHITQVILPEVYFLRIK